MGKGQASPATFDALEQTNQNHILCSGIFGLVGLGSMIEDVRAPEDLSACFGVDEIIQCNQQAPIGERIRNHALQDSPKFIPWEFVGCHKGAESTSVGIDTEEVRHRRTFEDMEELKGMIKAKMV